MIKSLCYYEISKSRNLSLVKIELKQETIMSKKKFLFKIKCSQTLFEVGKGTLSSFISLAKNKKMILTFRLNLNDQ
jgi:hypothetical protein